MKALERKNLCSWECWSMKYSQAALIKALYMRTEYYNPFACFPSANLTPPPPSTAITIHCSLRLKSSNQTLFSVLEVPKIQDFTSLDARSVRTRSTSGNFVDFPSFDVTKSAFILDFKTNFVFNVTMAPPHFIFLH